MAHASGNGLREVVACHVTAVTPDFSANNIVQGVESGLTGTAGVFVPADSDHVLLGRCLQGRFKWVRSPGQSFVVSTDDPSAR